MLSNAIFWIESIFYSAVSQQLNQFSTSLLLVATKDGATASSASSGGYLALGLVTTLTLGGFVVYNVLKYTFPGKAKMAESALDVLAYE